MPSSPSLSWHTLVFTGGPIATHGAITGGSAYTDGSYTNVPLTGGLGSGATANITVSGGAVTVVTIVTAGPTVGSTGATGYQVGDVLSAAAANIGGTGSGFSTPVATISTWSYTPKTNQIYATLVGGGAGGGGGHATGGAGGGGGSGMTIQDLLLPVIAGTPLTCRVAAATGSAAIGANGGASDYSQITGGLIPSILANGGSVGAVGGVANGGSGGAGGTPGFVATSGAASGPAGGAGVGTVGGSPAPTGTPYLLGGAGGAGAGTGSGGGGGSRPFSGTANIAGGANIGGGAGGCTPYGVGGVGGATTSAGQPGTGYGCGGGGGGQNSTGGAGNGGLVIIREFY